MTFQIEFGGDIGSILAYISHQRQDSRATSERLVGALADIKRLYEQDGSDLIAGRPFWRRPISLPEGIHNFWQEAAADRTNTAAGLR